MGQDVLTQLAATIRERRHSDSARSYTRQLLDGGPERCARKLGEEAIETVIAGISQDGQALCREAADLLYHLLVLLEARDVKWDDVLAELARRSGVSGLDEKSARGRDGDPA